MTAVRNDWSVEAVREIFDRPFLDLVFDAARVHREHHDASEVQVNQLISIRPAGAPENCSYCPQSAHNDAGIRRSGLLDVDSVLAKARAARAAGATRFCMGAAWRE